LAFYYLGKWDPVTGINSPLYRSNTNAEEHDDWKNVVRNGRQKLFCFVDEII